MPSDAEEIAQLKLEVQRLGRLVDALRAGNLIMAIKLWRGYTNLGLAEAKSEMEELQRRLGV